MTELPDDTEYKVWLVWKLVGSLPTLVAIDTSEVKANKHVAYDKLCDEYNKKPLCEYFVEQSKTNHLYGQSISDLASFKISKILQKSRS